MTKLALKALATTLIPSFNEFGYNEYRGSCFFSVKTNLGCESFFKLS